MQRRGHRPRQESHSRCSGTILWYILVSIRNFMLFGKRSAYLMSLFLSQAKLKEATGIHCAAKIADAYLGRCAGGVEVTGCQGRLR